MEKTARIFHSFAEADKAEAEFYRSLTPEQRMEFFSIWSAPNNPMELNQDLKEFVELLDSRKNGYMLVGGHAFGGTPKAAGEDARAPQSICMVTKILPFPGFRSCSAAWQK